MNRLFRIALEGGDADTHTPSTDEKTIVMKGPLAEVYTDALQVAYAKEPVTGEVAALESQMQDVALMQKLANQLIPMDEPPSSVLTVYGVSKDDVQEGNVVEVAQQLADTPGDRRDDFIVIIDATMPGPNGQGSSAPTEQVEMLGQALESAVLAFGGKVFHSLKDFALSR